MSKFDHLTEEEKCWVTAECSRFGNFAIHSQIYILAARLNEARARIAELERDVGRLRERIGTASHRMREFVCGTKYGDDTGDMVEMWANELEEPTDDD